MSVQPGEIEALEAPYFDPPHWKWEDEILFLESKVCENVH